MVYTPELAPGVHMAHFKECLVRSIAADKALTDFEGGEIWPTDMEEGAFGTLGVTKKMLMQLIGRTLQIGPHAKTWTHAERSKVVNLLKAGLRRFYTPSVLPGERHAHRWSFMAPTFAVTLTAEQYSYLMPDGFCGVRGDIHYAAGTNRTLPKIRHTSVERVLAILAESSGSYSEPLCAAFRVRPRLAETAPTQWEMLIAPAPSGGEQLVIPFEISPMALSDDDALPLGGQPHAQTIIEACLAEAELEMGSPKPIHLQLFMERLQASVSHDRMATCPLTVGISRDRSDDLMDEIIFGDIHGLDNHIATYDPTR
jgi:hypothetical protein